MAQLRADTAAKPDLVEPRSRFNPDTEAARRNLRIERAFVPVGNVIEDFSIIRDEASENVEPARRTLGIGGARNRVRKRKMLKERHDIDASFFEDRAALLLEIAEFMPFQLLQLLLNGSLSFR